MKFHSMVAGFLIKVLLIALSSSPASGVGRGLDTVTPGSPLEETLGTYHALIVGINKYKEWRRLQTAVKDAVGLRDVLVEQYGFIEKNVILLTDEQATRLRILQDLRALASNLGEKDNLLIYFAGHGQLDDLTGDGYWIPVEGKLKDPGTWLSNSLLKSILGSEKVRIKNVVVIADSCYSGALLRGRPSLLTLSDREAYLKKLAQAAAKRSRQVITSGGMEPVADGGRDGHSLFAYYLITALRENKHEVIDLENLFHTEVWEAVTEVGGQRPNVGRIKTPMDEDGQFVLKNRGLGPNGPADSELNEKQRLLEEEKARLEAEWRQLESERKLLEEKKHLLSERLKLEREKKLVEQEAERNRLELAELREDKSTQEGIAGGKADSDTPAAAMPRIKPPERPEAEGTYTVAVFPGTYEWDIGRWGTHVNAEHSYEVMAGELSRNLKFRLARSPSAGGDDAADVANPFPLSPEESGRIWVKGGLFSNKSPDPEAVAEIGRRYGVDLVLMSYFSGDLELMMESHLIETRSGRVLTEKTTGRLRRFDEDLIKNIDTLLGRYLSENGR